MAEETTHHFLGRREQELIAQISALRGQLEPKIAELAQVQKMRGLLSDTPGSSSLAGAALLERSNSPLAQPFVSQLSAAALTIAGGAATPYEGMTIKELAIQALIDGFPNGATLAEIRDFVRAGYGRTIEPSSLRPQMHRLKDAGVLGHDPSTDTWNFQDGKRRLYTMYNHPTSRAGMPELRDEEPEMRSTNTSIKRV